MTEVTDITKRIAEKGEKPQLNYSRKKVAQSDLYILRNLISVVNLPEQSIRGYIFGPHENLQAAYKGNSFDEALENAEVSFLERMIFERMRDGEFFKLGFVFGKNNDAKDRDIFPYILELSKHIHFELRSFPRIIKNGQLETLHVREKGEFWPILKAEQDHFYDSITNPDGSFDISLLPGFINNIPKIEGIVYK